MSFFGMLPIGVQTSIPEDWSGYGVGAGAYRLKKTKHGFKAKEIWRKPKTLMNHWRSPVYNGGYVYGLYGHKQYGDAPLKCVNILTEKTLWAQKKFGQGSCILVDDYIIALSNAGHVVVLEARTKHTRNCSDTTCCPVSVGHRPRSVKENYMREAPGKVPASQ